MTVRGAILPNLESPLTHEQIRRAPVLARNQEEGGGGFQRADRGYLSTWQIPWVNDPTALQRLYEFDLADPLNPESWRVVPGSWGWNDGTRAVEDGGATADAWSLSYLPESDTLWATSVVWSVSNRKNSILACRVPWNQRLGDVFRYGVPRVAPFNEVTPVIEYAVGTHGSLSAEIAGSGTEAYVFVFLAPSSRHLFRGSVALEVSNQGARLAAYSEAGQAAGLTPYQEPKWASGRFFNVKLRRQGNRLEAWVDGVRIGPVAVTDAPRRQLLEEPQRFKLYGWQGGLYTVRNAVLTDGPEKD
jgi:hypothetical protein